MSEAQGAQRWVAFLRAINVGGHTVKMDHLRGLFEALGFARVETFIASGNVIFETPEQDARALEKRIEAHLRDSLGYEVATFLRSPAELEEAARREPFPDSTAEEAHAIYVAFLPAPLSAEAQQKLLAYRSEIDEFAICDREVYWLCRKSMHESTFSGALLEKTIQMPATMRNITTVRKMAARYSD